MLGGSDFLIANTVLVDGHSVAKLGPSTNGAGAKIHGGGDAGEQDRPHMCQRGERIGPLNTDRPLRPTQFVKWWRLRKTLFEGKTMVAVSDCVSHARVSTVPCVTATVLGILPSRTSTLWGEASDKPSRATQRESTQFSGVSTSCPMFAQMLISSEEAHEMVRDADAGGDGHVDYEEFQELAKRVFEN